jgi:hypothetical protein
MHYTCIVLFYFRLFKIEEENTYLMLLRAPRRSISQHKFQHSKEEYKSNLPDDTQWNVDLAAVGHYDKILWLCWEAHTRTDTTWIAFGSLRSAWETGDPQLSARFVVAGKCNTAQLNAMLWKDDTKGRLERERLVIDLAATEDEFVFQRNSNG